MSEVFIEYGHLPEDTRKNLAGLEDLLCDMDGKTLCSDGGEDEQGRPTFVDEGCIVVDDYVSAFNGLVAALTRLQQANAALVEREKQSQAALKVALEEIDWWASEHGCCLGHQDHAVTVINSALAQQ